MIKPIPKPRKIKIKTVKKKADDAFSLFIRKRDNWTCKTCGAVCEDPTDWKQRKMFHAGHYIERSVLPLRYDEKNVHCQCYTCNVPKKGNYTVYSLKMLQMYGQEFLFELDEIKRKSKSEVQRYPVSFYQGIIEKYSNN